MSVDTCGALRVDISARLDDELDDRRAREVEEHLASCEECRAYEKQLRRVRRALRVHSAEEVPNLTQSIMAKVQTERVGAARRREWHAGARIAAVAAVVAALVVLTTSVPFTDDQPGSADASEIVQKVRAAAEELTSFRATFSIVERGLTDSIDTRNFTAKVRYEAPERFRLQVRDDTTYPDPRWPANDISLIASASRWWIEQPRTCPIEVLLECSVPQGTSERTVVERQPFDGSSTLPTDIIVPLETMASAGDFDVIGRSRIAGRGALKVAMPFRDAVPLVTALEPAGLWRTFHPLDRVEIWLDEKTWFPLRFQVMADPSGERAAWAELQGYDDRPGDTLLAVTARRFSQRALPQSVFRPPEDGTIRTGDFVPVSGTPAGWPIPGYTGGLDAYRNGLTPDERRVSSWADGMTWLKATSGAARSGLPAFPPDAETVRLADGSVAYYLPATETIKRRIDIFTGDEHIHLETNLSRAELIKVASSFGLKGEALDSVVERSRGASVERINIEEALGYDFVKSPRSLPEGYRASAALLTRSRPDGRSITIYFRRSEAEYGGDGIAILQSPSIRVLAPSGEMAGVQPLDGVDGRWFPARGELEWIKGGVYRSVTVPTGDLSTALSVARSLE